MNAARLSLASLCFALGCSAGDLPVVGTPGDAAVVDTPSGSDVPFTFEDDTPKTAMDVPVGRDATTPTDASTPSDVPATTQDTPAPRDVPAPPSDTPVAAAAPPLDAATQAHVHDVLVRGAAMGNRADVFAKIGDSITESGSFLIDCGNGDYDLGMFPSLDTTLAYFSRVTFPDIEGTDRVNSFSRHSLCAMGGWVSSQAITPYLGESTPRLVQELMALRPGWALVEYGTNDVLTNDWSDPSTHPESDFRNNLGVILDMVEARAVVPVVYTIPPLLSTSEEPRSAATIAGVDTLNTVIRAAAASRHIPLIEFHDALERIPGVHGLDTDGIHPTAFEGSNACILTPAGLQYGYNLRNLITIQMLARLMVTR